MSETAQSDRKKRTRLLKQLWGIHPTYRGGVRPAEDELLAWGATLDRQKLLRMRGVGQKTVEWYEDYLRTAGLTETGAIDTQSEDYLAGFRDGVAAAKRAINDLARS